MKNNTNTVQLTPAQLREAAELQEQIEKLNTQAAEVDTKRGELTKQIDEVQTKYNAIFGIVAGQKSGHGTGRHFSEAIRSKISEGQKRKWAERKAAAELLAKSGATTTPATTEQPVS